MRTVINSFDKCGRVQQQHFQIALLTRRTENIANINMDFRVGKVDKSKFYPRWPSGGDFSYWQGKQVKVLSQVAF